PEIGEADHAADPASGDAAGRSGSQAGPQDGRGPPEGARREDRGTGEETQDALRRERADGKDDRRREGGARAVRPSDGGLLGAAVCQGGAVHRETELRSGKALVRLDEGGSGEADGRRRLEGAGGGASEGVVPGASAALRPKGPRGPGNRLQDDGF